MKKVDLMTLDECWKARDQLDRYIQKHGISEETKEKMDYIKVVISTKTIAEALIIFDNEPL